MTLNNMSYVATWKNGAQFCLKKNVKKNINRKKAHTHFPQDL